MPETLCELIHDDQHSLEQSAAATCRSAVAVHAGESAAARLTVVEPMLDHVFITVKDLARSIAFYETALKPLGIRHAVDYDGKDGPKRHPDLKGFGRDGRVFFWFRGGL
jgi:hypothetical protein